MTLNVQPAVGLPTVPHLAGVETTRKLVCPVHGFGLVRMPRQPEYVTKADLELDEEMPDPEPEGETWFKCPLKKCLHGMTIFVARIPETEIERAARETREARVQAARTAANKLRGGRQDRRTVKA